MLFADLFFIFFFLPLCLLAYFFFSGIRAKNIVLIVFSLIFYAWGEPIWVFLLFFSAAFNWYMGLKTARFRDRNLGKAIAALALVVNIGLLLGFKYTGFFVATINSVFGSSIPLPGIVLPIGISFYTLQAVSYIIDCYRGTIQPPRKFPLFLLYFSLFPKLIAGPVVSYGAILDELTRRKADASDIYDGIVRFVTGLTKKVLIADGLWGIVQTFWGTDITHLSTIGTWYTVIIYSMYIYFDFSGYCDMAIGIGRILGFHFPENFSHPFICRSITEFWQRWHITLGVFFRDYLLDIRIFRNRGKYAGFFLVWFCIGLWHGASWNFVLWGLYYGLFILFEQLLGKERMNKWPVWVSHIYSKLVILIGFGIFYFEDFGQMGRFFANLSGISMLTAGNALADILTWDSLISHIFLIITAVILCMPVREKVLRFFLSRKDLPTFRRVKIGQMLCCIILLVICAILLVDKTSQPFLYWRF